jgi:hypothetical protein
MAGTTPVKPGTVNFCNAAVAYCTDITLLGTAQLTANGTATIKFRPGVGSHSYKAVFAGNKTDAASSSGAAALTVTGPYISKIGAWVSADESEFPDYNYIIELGGNAGVAPSGPISLLDTSNGNGVVASPPIYTDTGAAFLPLNIPAVSQSIGVFGSQAADAVVVQDFNGDGIPDLAVSENGPAIRVLLGNGDGTFTAKASFVPTEPGTGFEFIAAGDFNGDGVPDLVVSPGGPGGGGGSTVVYLGNGDGTFTMGEALSGIAGLPVVGDFNGDGNLDIAVVAPYEISVWLGSGDGTFAYPAVVTTFPASAGDYNQGRAVAGDFNGDGVLDLAVTLSGATTGQLAIFTGNGDGTFTAGATEGVAGSDLPADYVVAGDFTRNGILDLAVLTPGNGAPSSLAILIGQGSGTFTVTTTTVPSLAYLALADFNQDGIPDLALVGPQGDGETLYGNGDGTFRVGPTTGGLGEGNTCIAVGDFNGDGVPDIAMSHTTDRSMKILLTENHNAYAKVTGLSVPATDKIVASFPGDSNYKPSVSQPDPPCVLSPLPGACD